MFAHPGGPVEAPSGRRIDTYYAAGLDYSTCYRIEDDIPTRIRSLLLSRHAYRPPRTPWPSDEVHSRQQEDPDIIDSFDFNSSRSVTESAHQESAGLILKPKPVRDSPYVPETLPVYKRAKRSALRSSSTNDARGPSRSFDGVDGTEGNQILNDAVTQQSLLTRCLPCQPDGADKTNSGFGDLDPQFADDTFPVTVDFRLHLEDDLPQTLQSVPRCERLLPGPSIRTILSKSSMQPTARAPSLETTASKSSSYRHALLRPSVAAWQPVDLGLPIQPFLMSTPDALPSSESLHISKNSLEGHSHQHSQVTSVEALTNLLQSPHSKGNSITGNESNKVDTMNPPPPLTVNKAEDGSPRAATSNAYVTASSSVGESGHAAGAYQNTIPEPLAEAARTADEYLKRSTFWNGASGRNSVIVIDTPFQNHSGDASSTYSGAHQQPPTSMLQNPLSGARGSMPDQEAFLDTASDNTGSYENLAPQKLFDLQRFTTGLAGKIPRSKSRKWKHSPGDHGSRYATIPARKSSLDQRTIISRTSSTTPSSNKDILRQLVAKAGERVQSMSSKSSSNSNLAVIQDSKFSKINEKGLILSEKPDSRLATHWLQKLVPEQEPYVTRFTAIPARKHRLSMVTPNSVRSVTTFPIGSLTARSRSKDSEPRASETFTRTITDLENLMNEALFIARRAAEGEDAEFIPEILNESRVVLQSDSEASRHAELRRHDSKRNTTRSASCSQGSDDLVNARSVHESARSISSDSSSQSSSVSMYIYQDSDQQIISEAARQRNGDVVVPPTRVAHSLSASPVTRISVLHASTMLASLKSIATGLLRKTSKVNSLEQVVVFDPNATATDGSPAIPAAADGQPTSNGSTDRFPQNADENRLELFIGEQCKEEHMRAEPVKSKLIGSNAKPAVFSIGQPYEEHHPSRVKVRRQSEKMLNKREVKEFIGVFHQPPIQSRHSSLALRKTEDNTDRPLATASAVDHRTLRPSTDVLIQKSHRSFSLHTLSVSQGSVSEVDFSTPPAFRTQTGPAEADTPQRVYQLKDSNEAREALPKRHISGRLLQDKLKHLKDDRFSHLSLRGKSHISLRDHKGFSLSKSHRRQPIARDWSPGRKRFVASVACISTALIGIIIGIYAGEVPSIQYYIADFSHYAILGNVFFFITLAITTFLFWPLPLLHGRKPYILSALTIAMPLLFPQAISVSMQRSPYVATWRVALILPRTLMGAALGFANINFMAMLTDLFGASLQSSNPHQETVDEYDVRRHGGGLGVWLGIWTWCYIGSIGIGFLIGALVINTLSPDWGFYVSIIIIAAVLLLNVITPEVRRSAYRRSLTEVRNGIDISRRLARGEVMMHRLQTGPKWWGQEFHQGVMLSADMMRQPGFLIMSLYVGWMYGQIVLVIVLLGSLMSKYYRFTSPAVGLTTLAIPLGALLAVPFQKASLFSRARRQAQRTDSMTFERKITFSSHIVRRAIFTLVLPFAGLAYTLSSGGPPTPFILPVLFAGFIGFLSNLAIAECNGIIMETFDTSDLQPGMTGRPRGASGERTKHKRTNYSSFPRVSSAFAIIQSLGFLIGATATGVGGVAERHLGQMSATGVMAGILLILTLAVLGVLVRFKEVQIIPAHREEDIEKWERERRMGIKREAETSVQGTSSQARPIIEEPWRPVIIGNPSGRTRRMSILELGAMSRWSEIRRKNRLVDETSYEARHPNLATLEDVRKEIRDKNLGGLRRDGSRRSRRSQLSQGSEEPDGDIGTGDLGERTRSD